MLALSIQQPWAWLIVNGYKDVENRTWPTRITGEFLIHAGKKFDHLGYDIVREQFPHIPLPYRENFEFGGIVGSAEIYDCVDHCDSDWYTGDWGFLLRNAKPLPFVPLRGQLGFFEVGELPQPKTRPCMACNETCEAKYPLCKVCVGKLSTSLQGSFWFAWRNRNDNGYATYYSNTVNGCVAYLKENSLV